MPHKKNFIILNQNSSYFIQKDLRFIGIQSFILNTYQYETASLYHVVMFRIQNNKIITQQKISNTNPFYFHKNIQFLPLDDFFLHIDV